MALSLANPCQRRLTFVPNAQIPARRPSFLAAAAGPLPVLGIETSCDDTGAAVVSGDGKILGEALRSQAELLRQYGGVMPLAARLNHEQAIDEVVAQALENAKVKESDLAAVAVTIGPGLSLCLDVGVRKARSISRCWRLPFVGVHHMEAHALVARLTNADIQFPFLVLLVSGGHNLLLIAKDVGDYVELGTTLDDAVGEAYDKTARLLGLDICKGGGPALEELALEGDADAFKFTVPMRSHKDCNFSYAGLKTQVKLTIESLNINGAVPLASASSSDRQSRANVAASFQVVAVRHLEDRCRRALEWARELEPCMKRMVIAGGVASNKYLRSRLGAVAKEHQLDLFFPPPRLCTDNGVMVAWTGVEYLRLGLYDPPPPVDEPEDYWVDLRPRWKLGEICRETSSGRPVKKNTEDFPSLTSQISQKKSALNAS
ncbi:hypothetical protein SELMODRAFT_123080 [Selaginella moellendorffii]|uniref:Glycoprotease 1 n=1 Tax=Selaginella moellendorffii TaxID=88036 RepID=D8SR76_SELML|nr:hypothetical protein SELMODRAFT_123080 [Selaginella moellendorffii]